MGKKVALSPIANDTSQQSRRKNDLRRKLKKGVQRQHTKQAGGVGEEIKQSAYRDHSVPMRQAGAVDVAGRRPVEYIPYQAAGRPYGHCDRIF